MEKASHYNVAIIGGGLAGISTAYFLASSGVSCAVLEAQTIGSGATAKTTAFITHLLDTPLAELMTMFGRENARLAWESHRQAIDAIESIIQREHINCSFTRCPSFYFADSAWDSKKIVREYQAARSLGFDAEMKSGDSFPMQASEWMKIGNQAKFQAEKYIKGLARAATEKGAAIFEHAQVASVEKSAAGFHIAAGTLSLDVQQLAICTYHPFGHQVKTHFKKGMYVSYVLETAIPKNTLPEAIYQDTENPYHYFRIDPADNYDSLILGGQDHRQEIPMDEEKNFQLLETYLQRLLSGAAYRILSRWTGPILEPSDGLALIGEIQESCYVATAFSGNGMTYSTITGQLLSDCIQGRENPYQKLYTPNRILNLKSIALKGRDYFMENLRTILGNLLG